MAFQKVQLKQALKYAIPLIPNSISWWIINVSDRTMITIIMNSSFNGIYSVANRFATAFVSLYTVFNLSWTESASLNINDKDKDKFFTIEDIMKDKKSYFLKNDELKKLLNGVKIQTDLKDGLVKIYYNQKFIGLGEVENNFLKRKIILEK